MKKKILITIATLLLVFGSIGYFLYVKYNEVPNVISSFNESGVLFNLDDSEFSNKLFYSQLDDKAKLYYQCLYNSSKEYDISFTYLFEHDENSLDKALRAFSFDWPQYYWWDEILDEKIVIENNLGKKFVYYKITSNTDSKEDVTNDGELIVNEGLKIANEVKSDNDYETIKNLHDYIINNVTYDEDVLVSQDLRSVLLNKVGVCAGYSEAFQYVANILGYDCYSVTGETIPEQANGVFHEWNIIHIGDNWYWVDNTWDEIIDEDDNEVNIGYEYFLASSSAFMINHILPNDFLYPECKDDSLYYLNMPGKLIYNLDENEIETFVTECIKNGYHTIELKFINNDNGLSTYDWLDNNGFFDLYEKNISETYSLGCLWQYDEGSQFLEIYWYYN